ncbi:hypothetical protein [Parapedobacter tibetensis]|uniref:hypothetical protein n=1 Tax=Parapedobacter tibetensis TaxID=2972951 RepID=UPI00214DD2F9|nr:hypothetical protein [Parapedobacter tibetensis]
MKPENKKGRELHKFLLKIDKNYQSIIIAAGHLNEGQVAAVIKKERLKIYGKEFYYSIVDVEGEIDDACHQIFGDIELPNFIKPIGKSPKKTRLANYLEQFVVEQRDIAVRIDTAPNSFSHFVSGEREIFAYKVYLIAKAHNRKPSEAFEFLYGPNGIGRV